MVIFWIIIPPFFLSLRGEERERGREGERERAAALFFFSRAEEYFKLILSFLVLVF
jgi:hypothetical protein